MRLSPDECIEMGASFSREPLSARTCAVAIPIILVAAAALAGPVEVFRVPAEFERQASVWVSLGDYRSPAAGFSQTQVIVELLKVLKDRVGITILTEEGAGVRRAKAVLRENGIDAEAFKYVPVPRVQVFVRDYGPVFLIGDRGTLRLADVPFNSWGTDLSREDPFTRGLDAIHRIVASRTRLEMTATAIAGEGGGREFNGRGVLVVSEEVEFQRNPGVGKSRIEEEHRRTFGIRKVIWLKSGMAQDDSILDGRLPADGDHDGPFRVTAPGGHVDSFCRFVSPDTVLLAEASAEDAERSPIQAENRRRLEESALVLRASSDQDGRPFRIVRMPVPEITTFELGPGDGTYDLATNRVFKDGSRLPAGRRAEFVPASSYLNFVISNGVVVAPRYWKPGLPERVLRKDMECRETLRRVFPDREVIQVDVMPLNLGGGGLHCATIQEPAL